MLSVHLLAQKTATFSDPWGQFNKAKELFDLDKFTTAKNIFEELQLNAPAEDRALKMHTAYYVALCASSLNQREAEYLLESFITDYPESAAIYPAYFQLGQVQFANKNYRNALKSFEPVDPKLLNNQDLAAYYFKTGYCYLKNENLAKARQLFNNLRGTKSAYTTQATYYFAHIAYMNEEYETALKEFQLIRNTPEYKNQVPYYLVNIYYKQGKFPQAIDEGAKYFSGDRTKLNAEMAKVIGDAHYRLGNFAEARPLIEFYHANNRRQPTREESFQLGYLNYMSKKYGEAIQYFQPVAQLQDSLAQFAFYHIADCYLKTGQKQYAANAFMSAYKMNFDQNIREDALFNYAQLASELSYNPYNEAIKAMNQYLRDFPGSKRKPEALAYLTHLYLTTNNYREALASIEAIERRDDKLNEAYQKINYYRGIELFNDKDLFNAIPLFKKASENSKDAVISAQALFWTGEAYFRLAQHDLAVDYFNRFLSAKASRTLPIYSTAHYNIGYAFFQKKDYLKAVEWFGRFLENEKTENPRMVSDALLRTGDCHFINKRYREAIAQYDKAMRLSGSEADYATLQKGRAQGALGNYREKITTLQAFRQVYRKSTLAAEALFEMGNTALLLNQENEALGYFTALRQEYPESSLAKNSLMKTGLIYYNENNNTRALEIFKKVINDFPGSPEAHEALANIRNIYIDLNQVDEYVSYSKGLSFAQVTDREQDSMTYVAALNKYMANDCVNARSGFSNYLSRYPRGLYVLTATYYRADCYFRANNANDALADYESVIAMPRSEFTENALLRAARINLAKNNLAKAADQFFQLETVASTTANKIEALSAGMRLSFRLERYQQSIDAAQRLLSLERLPETLAAEATLYHAKSLYALLRQEQALQAFRETVRLSPSGSIGAEAKFMVAQILFDQKKYTDTEKTVFELASGYASYDYWVAKGFILLADNYRQTGNIFQARQTLQSVIDNYQGEELREIARKKLRELPAGN